MTLTSVGAILLLGTGHALAGAHGGIAPNPWMVWSYLAFGLSGVLWLLVLVLIPIQIKQLSLLRNPILGGLVAYPPPEPGIGCDRRAGHLDRPAAALLDGG